MGLVTPPPQPSSPHFISTPTKPPPQPLPSPASMSQDFHHHHHRRDGVFSFSDAFERATNQDHQRHLARHTLLEEASSADEASVPAAAGIYEHHNPAAANVLSELFNFPTSPPLPPSANELLASQIQQAGGYHDHHPAPQRNSAITSAVNWQMNTDSATEMQLFLMHPPPPRSPSPPPSAPLHHQALRQASFGDSMSFGGRGSVVEGQGLSLSLSSSLHPSFEMAKAAAEELRVGEDVIYFNQQQQQHQQSTTLHFVQQHGLHMASAGYSSSESGGGMANILRTSKYSRPALELLEEFCSVGRGQIKSSRVSGGGIHRTSSANPNTSGGGGQVSSSSTTEIPALSPTDRFEQQRKKAKLLTMLDEVERRYSNYCEQMQTVVNSFDSVMGYGAATPYTTLAQKAMSRHFRCLKDAISAQLKQACELLGEKDGGAGSSSVLTKGETPRLKLLDRSLRQQRAFHQMGIVEQEAWRPQRGLPERSVNILRAWLFGHFLNPYPSDADKHMLARQTGLSRNQVSNWFINARVRLWKPMVEEMYQEEAKEEACRRETSENHETPNSSQSSQQQQQIQTAEHHHTDPSSLSVQHRFSSPDNFPAPAPPLHTADDSSLLNAAELVGSDSHCDDSMYHMTDYNAAAAGSIRFGTAGDVSLSLGLRHVGSAARTEQGRFSVRDFSNC